MKVDLVFFLTFVVSSQVTASPAHDGGLDRILNVLDEEDSISVDKKKDKVIEDPASPFFGTCSQESTSCQKKVWDVNHKSEVITRVGLGENVGLPGMAFLGIGYNIFEGNPRGTDSSEFDPGFKNRVITFTPDQNSNTIDQEFLLPAGVGTIETFTCKFSSESKEISNEQEYQKELSKEAQQTNKASLSGIGVVKGIPVAGSAKFSFTQSEKYQSFTQTQSKTQIISFEAKAQCTERELYFKPYTEQENDGSFQRGLKTLPYPFDKNNPEHIPKYQSFIDAFGTHVISRVSLGGKHIVSTNLESKDVMDLKRQKVEISRTLSFEASVSAGASASDGAQQAAEAAVADELGPDQGYAPTPSPTDNIYTIFLVESDKRPDPPLPNAPCVDPDGNPRKNRPSSCDGPKSSKALGFTASFASTQSSSRQKSTEQLSKIQSKVQTRDELTIGGTPPEDGNWRAWAASVRDRPVPVSYELLGLWTLMSDTDTDAARADDFISAFFAIYGIDLTEGEETNPILDQMRMGIFGPEGVPITSYSESSASNFRSVVQVEQFTPDRAEEAEVVIYEGESPDARGGDDMKNCPRNFFGCGVSLTADTGYDIPWYDCEGVYALTLRCCHEADWHVQTDVPIVDIYEGESTSLINYGRTKFASSMCPTDFYMSGVNVNYSGQSDTEYIFGKIGFEDRDPFGIAGLKFKCAGPNPSYDPNTKTSENNKPVIDFKNDVSVLSSINGDEERGFRGMKTARELTFGFVVGLAADAMPASGFLDSKEGYGIDGIKAKFRERKFDEGVPHDTYQYSWVWEGSTSFVSAFFAMPIKGDVAPNGREEKGSLGLGVNIQLGALTPFGLMSTQEPQKARIIVHDFDDLLKTTDLRTMSMIAADNNPLLDLVAGVIHPDAYTVNEVFGQETGFDLSVDCDGNFVITFTEVSTEGPPRTGTPSPTTLAPTPSVGTENPSMSPSSSSSPSGFPSAFPSPSPTMLQEAKKRTIVTFPIWFSTSDLPNHAGEVVVAPKEICDDVTDSCTISVGTNITANSALGFSFLSFKKTETETTPGVVHGSIELKFNDMTKRWDATKLGGTGFTVVWGSGYDCFEDCIYDVTNGTINDSEFSNNTVRTGGVQILFDYEFTNVPGLYVSPILNDKHHTLNVMDYRRSEIKPDAFRLPSSVVESISRTGAFIRAGWIDEAEDCLETGDDALEENALLKCKRRNADTSECDLLPRSTATSLGCNSTIAPNATEAERNATLEEFQDCLDAVDRALQESKRIFDSCVNEAYALAAGPKETTFEPLSFYFVAVGPPGKERPVNNNRAYEYPMNGGKDTEELINRASANSPAPTSSPSSDPSSKPTSSPSSLPSPDPSSKPSSAPSPSPSMSPTESPYCFDDKCIDDDEWRSRSGLPCRLHRSLPCLEWGMGGYTEEDIYLLVNACPCTCNIECGTYTKHPTTKPSKNPTVEPTQPPTPSQEPSAGPTDESQAPSLSPSTSPTDKSQAPSQQPSAGPTDESQVPSLSPSTSPTDKSQAPSLSPSTSPTDKSQAPSQRPSASPTDEPSNSRPTDNPSKSPTEDPTSAPTIEPSKTPVVPVSPPTDVDSDAVDDTADDAVLDLEEDAELIDLDSMDGGGVE